MILVILILLILILILISNKKTQHFNNTSKKIAFLFLIKDKINKEYLWNNFLKNVDKNKYNIYIHYKNDETLNYFDKYKINKIVPTKWGDISLVIAQKILLEEAMKDESNYKFIYVSDSCIPIKSFDYIYKFLTKDNNSYFNTEIIKKNIHKTFQWFILNRENANIINNDTTEINKYNNTHAPDEKYFLTLLRQNNANNIIINKDTDKYTTYANWGNKLINLIKTDDFQNNYKTFNSKKQFLKFPYNYTELDNKELYYLINQTDCLFLRKILPDTIINEDLLPY